MICGSLRRPSPKGKPLAIPALGLWWLFGLLYQEGVQAGERALDLGGGVGMRLVWIPPGEFVMGGARPLPHQPGGRQVRVRLTRGFYLGATEITQEQCVKRGGSFYDFAESVHCGARDGYSEPGRYVNIGARVLVEP